MKIRLQCLSRDPLLTIEEAEMDKMLKRGNFFFLIAGEKQVERL